MLQLFFQHSDGSFDCLGNVETVESGFSEAMKDLKDRAPNFKSYYQRIWQDCNGWWWMDVGDHCCFYMIKGDWQ